MKILHFAAKKIHGYLNFNFHLHSDLTFLTGINGSGKTSAVRAITALLTPSISALANMAYESVTVTVAHEGAEILIESRRSSEEITIKCGQAAEALQIPILKQEAYEPKGRWLERQRDFYREQEAVNVRNGTLEAIRTLPTPMFLDLERRFQEGTRLRREVGRFMERTASVNPLAGSLSDSLGAAEELAEQTYRRFLVRKAEFTDSLKQALILAAFSEPREEVDMWAPPAETLNKISSNESILLDSLLQIGISEEAIQQVVQPFFRRVHEVATRLPDVETLGDLESRSPEREEAFKTMREWIAIGPQTLQIDRLVESVGKYNRQVRSAARPVERYLESVNGFLADSKKSLNFDATGSLEVLVKGHDKPRPINDLSSGERQLVVILTHLAFNRQAKRANILIIDEPELSLHVRWQELFVDAIVRASPELQLILATHSPSIIRGRLENCVDVEEARDSDRVLT